MVRFESIECFDDRIIITDSMFDGSRFGGGFDWENPSVNADFFGIDRRWMDGWMDGLVDVD